MQVHKALWETWGGGGGGKLFNAVNLQAMIITDKQDLA